MAYDPIHSLRSISRHLKASWKLYNDVFATFDDTAWNRKFGKTWTFAWQPYHLAFFDKMVADGIRNSKPVADTPLFRTMRDMNNWNNREFAKRPPNHGWSAALAFMQEEHDRLQHIMENLTEADLDKPAWTPLFMGACTARQMLQMSLSHNIGEYYKLWYRTGRRFALPDPDAVHSRLVFMLGFLSTTFNERAATGAPFTMVWSFNGPGGGDWTFRVADAKCVVTEADTASPDLRISMKPETMQKMISKMTPPPLLMLSGQMKVKGFMAMGKFAKLFPEPGLDDAINFGKNAMAVG